MFSQVIKGLWIGSCVFAAVLVANIYFVPAPQVNVTPQEVTVQAPDVKVTVPEIQVPEIVIPEIQVPEIVIPEIQVPEIVIDMGEEANLPLMYPLLLDGESIRQHFLEHAFHVETSHGMDCIVLVDDQGVPALMDCDDVH